MKPSPYPYWPAIVVCAGMLSIYTADVRAQGSLTPPGAPAPTMKTLDQVEPRTPISSLPYNINAAGSYYLTGSLTSSGNAIVVTADNVTIDLEGFALTGASGNSASAVLLNTGQKNLTVRNGTLSNWSNYAVFCVNGSTSRFEQLRVLGSGSLYGGVNSTIVGCTVINSQSYGIIATGQSMISQCVSRSGAQVGIYTVDDCSVLQCNASGNTGAGIQVGNGCVVGDCVADGNSSGIVTNTLCTVRDCGASNNTGTGITVGVASTVRGCTANTNTGTGSNGFVCGGGSTLQTCTASGNSGNGISAAFNCTLLDCTGSANLGNGIQFGDNSTVLRCTASGNTSASGLAAYNSSGNTNASGCTIADSTASGNVNGIGVGNGCTLRGCTARANTHDGILLSGASNQVIGNTVDANNTANAATYAGILVQGNNNRIDSNAVTGNLQYGLLVINGEKGNLIIRNSFTTAAYQTQSGDSVGPLVSMATGGAITSTSPWANFYTDN